MERRDPNVKRRVDRLSSRLSKHVDEEKHSTECKENKYDQYNFLKKQLQAEMDEELKTFLKENCTDPESDGYIFNRDTKVFEKIPVKTMCEYTIQVNGILENAYVHRFQTLKADSYAAFKSAITAKDKERLFKQLKSVADNCGDFYNAITGCFRKVSKLEEIESINAECIEEIFTPDMFTSRGHLYPGYLCQLEEPGGIFILRSKYMTITFSVFKINEYVFEQILKQYPHMGEFVSSNTFLMKNC